MTAADPDPPTRLTGKKGDMTFAMWVEIEGKPLPIYGVTEGDDGIPEAWVCSEIDKVSCHTLDRSKLFFVLADPFMFSRSVTQCIATIEDVSSDQSVLFSPYTNPGFDADVVWL
jgi:hypothetical protein